MPQLLTIMLFAAVGGIASAAFAIVFLWVREEHSALILPHFISFATGALLGAALLTLLAGLGVFFVIEKLVLWWHAHAHLHEGSAAACPQHADLAYERQAALHGEPHHDHGDARIQASGVLVLVGDSLHNALDGALIAAAFLGSVQLGVLTTFAVAAHEIPHRVGDFAILVQAGLSRSRALVLNLLTGFASVLGAVVAYFGLRETQHALPYALAFAAAGFLYIAVAGLIPGLHRRADARTSAVQVLLIAAGIAVIAAAERLAAQ